MTAMASATGPVRRVPVAGLLGAALFVLIAGLVGMHGLGSPGIGDTDHGHVPPSWSLSMHEGIGAGTAQPSLAADADRDSSGFGEFCLAVLNTVGLALLLALASRRGHEHTSLPSRVPLARSAVPRARGPDPPSLAALSVLRC